MLFYFFIVFFFIFLYNGNIWKKRGAISIQRNKGLSIRQNNNFKSVCLYKKSLHINEVLEEGHTYHLDDRNSRFKEAIKLNSYVDGVQADIDRVFLVDKGYKDGPELHCVTKKGIIFILNKEKYENHRNSFITILIARPNQVIRLYKECGLIVPQNILDKTKKYVEIGANNF